MFWTFLIALSLINPSPDLTSRPNMSALHGMGLVHHHQLQSKINQTRYHLFVSQPSGAPSGSLPTVYLLDGGITFPLLSAYSRYLTLAEDIPPVLIVGISYGTDDWEQGNARSRDFTAPSDERAYWGGAETFQQVLRREIIPLIEARYASDAARRIIFGQSLGGQFVLFSAQTDTNLFWGHIASNPALHRNLAFFLKQRPQPGPSDSKLFVASGSLDDARFRQPAVAWMKHWNRQSKLPWTLQTMTLDQHNHFSAAPESFRQGMAWLFSTPPD